jgi:hypothetical protein
MVLALEEKSRHRGQEAKGTRNSKPSRGWVSPKILQVRFYFSLAMMLHLSLGRPLS